jgi:hypothetical protein
MQLAILDNDLKLYGSRLAVAEPFVWKLFNISADPTESQDIRQEHPELVVALNASLQAWILDVAMSRTDAENGCDRYDPMAGGVAAGEGVV